MTDDTIKVYTGLEMPPARTAGIPYPFDEMKVGDAFLQEAGDEEEYKRMSFRVRGATYNANKKKAPKRFSARRIPGTFRIGVWRTE